MVEVLLALSILGLVLGGAYVVLNNSTLNERRAQERDIALQLAQAQIESMKEYANVSISDPNNPANNIILAGLNKFCMSISGTPAQVILNDTGPEIATNCYVDSSGNADPIGPTETQPQFQLIDQLKGTSPPSICATNLNCVYKVEVEWTDVSGNSQDYLTLYYKLYS